MIIMNITIDINEQQIITNITSVLFEPIFESIFLLKFTIFWTLILQSFDYKKMGNDQY